MDTTQATTDVPPRPPTVLLGLAAAALALCYAEPLAALPRHWASSPLYSFGFAVPLISGYIAWSRWPELRAIALRPAYWSGVSCTLVGIGLLVVGRLGALVTVQETSFVVVLAGLVLLFGGFGLGRLIWFPIVYLLLMVPVWNYPVALVQGPSRILSASLAVSFLHATRVPALRDTTFIVLPNVTLQVLQECSGVNQLITFAAMALPASYLFLRGVWRRVALVGIAIAVAYLSNGIRIALVGWLAYHGLGNGTLGAMHLMEGLAVSLVGYAVIGACLSGLSRIGSSNPKAGGRGSGRVAARSRRPWLEWSVVGILAVVGCSQLLFRPSEVRLAASLDSLPRQIDEWTADAALPAPSRFPALDDDLVQAYPTEAGERRFEGADAELVRGYRNPQGARAQVYVGYYRQQRDGKELTGEASAALDRVASPVTVTLPTGVVDVNQVERQQGQTSRGVLYWYDINGRIVRNIYLAKGYTLWDALTRGRTNGAVIMVAWSCSSGGSCETDRRSVIGFVSSALPLLRDRLASHSS